MVLRLSRPGWPALVMGAAAVAIVVVAWSAVGSSSASGVRERIITARKGVVQTTVSGSGNLQPVNQRDLSFSTSGRVAEVYVDAGDRVEEGQLLARLDSSSARVALAQAEAELGSANDALEGAIEADDGEGAPPVTGSDTAAGGSATSVPAARAAVDSAELAVASAQRDLAATKLRAPMQGTITAVDGKVGEAVGSGGSSSGVGGASSEGSASAEPAFMTFGQLSRFTMEVALSESDIGKVKEGQPATVTVNAAGGGRFAAKVVDVGMLSSSSSSGESSAVSYPVTLRLSQPGTKLRAGMSASADVVVAEADGLVVPTAAVRGGTVTVERDGERTEVPVRTGVVGDGTTLILSGVAAGDRVVVRSEAPTGTPGDGAPAGGGRLPGAGFGGGGGFPGGGAGPVLMRRGGP